MRPRAAKVHEWTTITDQQAQAAERDLADKSGLWEERPDDEATLTGIMAYARNNQNVVTIPQKVAVENILRKNQIIKGRQRPMLEVVATNEPNTNGGVEEAVLTCDPPVTAAQLARGFSIAQGQAVTRWARAYLDFPKPCEGEDGQRQYRLSEINDWAKRHQNVIRDTLRRSVVTHEVRARRSAAPTKLTKADIAAQIEALQKALAEAEE